MALSHQVIDEYFKPFHCLEQLFEDYHKLTSGSKKGKVTTQDDWRLYTKWAGGACLPAGREFICRVLGWRNWYTHHA